MISWPTSCPILYVWILNWCLFLKGMNDESPVNYGLLQNNTFYCPVIVGKQYIYKHTNQLQQMDNITV